jgi:hypothetical protein
MLRKGDIAKKARVKDIGTSDVVAEHFKSGETKKTCDSFSSNGTSKSCSHEVDSKVRLI